MTTEEVSWQILGTFDKNYIKMKEREQYLPDSCLQTSLEQADHNESGYISSFHLDLSATVMSTDMSQVGIALFASF